MHGGGRRFNPCQLHKKNCFLFFEIVENINESKEILSICDNKARKGVSQVTKGVWWMPWYVKTMKDVVSCDKLRGDANNL